MSIGEKIQAYRKNLGLSQEELGQKLLVSRQTISLWEKDQTIPAIDNLIHLKEIFNVSVDEILDVKTKSNSSEQAPLELYQFSFSENNYNDIYKLQSSQLYTKPITFALILISIILISISTSASDESICFALGMLFIYSISHIKDIHSYKKSWQSNKESLYQVTYQYKIFDNYLIIEIYRKNEKIRESKCYFTDIERIQLIDNYLFFIFGGQTFIIKKSDLKENSSFYSFMYNNPAAIQQPMPYKFKITSTILFAASLLSLFAAMTLVTNLPQGNNLSTEDMWMFLLFTPIPISSIIFGIVMKSKGYKYKKNIIIGIIMTIILCMYGSFTFIF